MNEGIIWQKQHYYFRVRWFCLLYIGAIIALSVHNMRFVSDLPACLRFMPGKPISASLLQNILKIVLLYNKELSVFFTVF